MSIKETAYEYFRAKFLERQIMANTNQPILEFANLDITLSDGTRMLARVWKTEHSGENDR
ncbi:MAG: hypothetical protein AAED33_12090 [Paracoccaceae bacterium]